MQSGHDDRRLRPILCLMLCALPLIGHEDPATQLATIMAAIAKDPRNAELLLRRAELHHLLGNLDQALADIARAQELGGAMPGGDLRLAVILMDRKDYAGAHRSFTRYLNGCGDDGIVHGMRADCALALGDATGAMADLESACRLLDQPDPDLVCRLADLLHAAGRTDEAIVRLDAAIARHGAVPAYLERALVIERAAQRHAAVLARLERLAATTGQCRWCVEYGDALVAVGRHAEALAAYREAAQAMADLPPLRRQSSAHQTLIRRIDQGLAQAASAGPATIPVHPDHASRPTSTTRSVTP
jgi:tetratricopeptide (TPR) repeat protein